MVYLNGEKVEKSEIKLDKHKFIGVFRAPCPPQGQGYIMCPCGQILQTQEITYDHYQQGHMDMPQYVDI